MYELEVDAKQMCRACLSRNSEMGNLFCSEIVDGDIVPMPDVYETVTGIQVSNKWNLIVLLFVYIITFQTDSNGRRIP